MDRPRASDGLLGDPRAGQGEETRKANADLDYREWLQQHDAAGTR